MSQTIVFDTGEASFEQEVLERSRRTPVVVDFWAAWCGPCRTLGPMIEDAVRQREGDVLLAKVDVDQHPALAQQFRVQGIPQVIGIRDGQVRAQFTGAVPADRIEAFLDELVPSEADRAVAAARDASPDEAKVLLRRALELETGHREAALALADLLAAEDPDAAVELARPHRPHPDAEAVVTRAELARSGGDVEQLRVRVERDPSGEALVDLGRALAAEGRHDEAMERLLDAVEHGGEAREAAREQLVALFGMLGDADPRVRDARPRLARALY